MNGTENALSNEEFTWNWAWKRSMKEKKNTFYIEN